MKKNIQFIIYILIIIILATVVWIKYDYDNKNSTIDDKITKEEQFKNFLRDNNIKSSTFSCPAKNESITYLDNDHLLTTTGDLYKVNFNYTFENGHNCVKIDSNIKFKNFYNNNNIIYDYDNTFYDINNNLEVIDPSISEAYKEDLNNLSIISKKFPYIYFYDVSSEALQLDDTLFSNKLLIDNRGNINVYTNYGYPTSLNLLENETVEVIFDRLNYMGVPLSIYRTRNNERLNKDKVFYFTMMEEVPDEVYGIRLITNKGMYNEVIDQNCKDKTCNTKLVLDKNFSKYFDNIIFTNGKYVFIKDTPTTIYNIENYVSNNE